MDADVLDGATEQRLLDATERVIRQIGISKTSMADVARAAGVARGTVYRYFDSREALLEAHSRRITDRFFADVTAAMDAQPTLSAQLGEFTQLMILTIHPEGSSHNQATMARMLSKEAAHGLKRTAGVLRPYVDAARARGEVATDLDVTAATEWLARILLSFTVFQASLSFAADDPRSVRLFVQRYAIDGLNGGPTHP